MISTAESHDGGVRQQGTDLELRLGAAQEDVNVIGQQRVGEDVPTAASDIATEQPQPFLTIFVIDHDVALFDAPLRDVIDALGNVQSRLPR